MSIPKIPDPGLLVISILSSGWGEFWPGLLEELEGAFGPADGLSEEFAFDQTSYYDEELGTPITRRLIEFKDLRPVHQLTRECAWGRGEAVVQS